MTQRAISMRFAFSLLECLAVIDAGMSKHQ